MHYISVIDEKNKLFGSLWSGAHLKDIAIHLTCDKQFNGTQQKEF